MTYFDYFAAITILALLGVVVWQAIQIWKEDKQKKASITTVKK